jgi:tetratricopeptide (TPR) repeat protein
MNINNIEEIQKEFEGFTEQFESGDRPAAVYKLGELLDALEEAAEVRHAGTLNKSGEAALSDGEGKIYISLNHVMEYYIYAYYFKPDTDVLCTEIPYGEYYRTYAGLCMQLEKFNAAKKAYKRAIAWNPVDLDSYLGLAEAYKNLNKLQKYIAVTGQAYRYCCTRATMARYYRNQAFYYLSSYKPEIARDCYLYSNVYYHTENADSELKYIEEALKEETPKLDIKAAQKVFDENGIEPGPDSDTIGIVYKVGEIMLKDGDYKLAKDCFSIVYDITQEESVENLLNRLEKALAEER